MDALNCLENQVAPQDRERVRARLEAAQENPDLWVWQLPVTECAQLEGVSPWHVEQIAHPIDLEWWSQTDAKTRFGEIDAPMLHVGGWYDLYLNGTLAHFTGLVEQGRSARCRHSQRLIVGPWTHGSCNEPLLPELLDFGPVALTDFKATAVRWFDRWLKGIADERTDAAVVQVFLMGENRWLEMAQWPPNDVIYTPVYLRHGTGRTEASLNNGHLTFEAPNTDEQPDNFTYDPADPVIGHHSSSPTTERDQREREGQLLTYTLEILATPLTVIGPIKTVIYAASSAPDTDWIVRLYNVDPSGRSTRICDGIVRARYRDSLAEASFLEPGRVYRYEIDMTATALTFLPGHRIRVHVTSSDFPRYDRNLNTGGPWGEETEGQVAVNTVFHDTERPSHVVLPIVVLPIVEASV